MVGVVTDSASNIPQELASELLIQVVPMYLKFGVDEFRDGVDIVGSDFYQRLLRDGELATTAAPAPGDFLEAIERTGQQEVVCVTVASGVSATYQAATVAAGRATGSAVVVDSQTASMAEGFVAIEAARAARGGASLDEVVRRAEDVASRARLFATIDTFEFLRKSGRVNKLEAFAATKLDIKPVFKFQQGEAGPVGRPRTRARALRRVVDETLKEIAGRPVHLAAIHAAAEDEARGLLDALSGEVQVVESYTAAFTPVMGAHTGPGVVGLAFFCD